VEQPPQPRSSPPPPPAASGGSAGPPAAPSEAGLLVCPTCNEPRQEDARYCEECGYDFGEAPPPSGTPAPPQERTRLTGPMLWLAVLFWAVLAVAGLYFLYTALYSL
jgi:hypothetical protein